MTWLSFRRVREFEIPFFRLRSEGENKIYTFAFNSYRLKICQLQGPVKTYIFLIFHCKCVYVLLYVQDIYIFFLAGVKIEVAANLGDFDNPVNLYCYVDFFILLAIFKVRFAQRESKKSVACFHARVEDKLPGNT